MWLTLVEFAVLGYITKIYKTSHYKSDIVALVQNCCPLCTRLTRSRLTVKVQKSQKWSGNLRWLTGHFGHIAYLLVPRGRWDTHNLDITKQSWPSDMPLTLGINDWAPYLKRPAKMYIYISYKREYENWYTILLLLLRIRKLGIQKKNTELDILKNNSTTSFEEQEEGVHSTTISVRLFTNDWQVSYKYRKV